VKNGLLTGINRLTFDFHQRTCNPQPEEAKVRNDFEGKVGLAFVVGSEADVVATALLRFLVEGNSQQHQLELLQVQSQSQLPVKVAEATIDLANRTALPIDSLGFAVAKLSRPVTLSKGQTYYLVSSEVKDGDQWLEQLPVHVNNKSGLSLYASVYSAQNDKSYHYGFGSMSYGPVSLYVQETVDIQYI